MTNLRIILSCDSYDVLDERAHFNPIFLAAHSNRCYCANAKSQLIALNLIAGLQVEYDSVDNLLT